MWARAERNAAKRLPDFRMPLRIGGRHGSRRGCGRCRYRGNGDRWFLTTAGRAATKANASITAMVAMRLVNFFICTFPFAPIGGSDGRSFASTRLTNVGRSDMGSPNEVS